MKVIKNINNNVALCIDSQGNEVVAFGRGIGFSKPPYEVPLSKIERTFYNVPPVQQDLLGTIPQDVLMCAIEIFDYANNHMGNRFYSNIVAALADHINFAIQRNAEFINIKLPLFYEIQQLYPEESAIGAEALKIIKKRLNVSLPKEEGSAIALHLVNYEQQQPDDSKPSDDLVIEQITQIVESHFEDIIDRDDFNYSRFVTHLHFLLQRASSDAFFVSEDMGMFESFREHYTKTYACVLKISDFFETELSRTLTPEEQLYLMIHVNRLCVREDFSL